MGSALQGYAENATTTAAINDANKPVTPLACERETLFADAVHTAPTSLIARVIGTIAGFASLHMVRLKHGLRGIEMTDAQKLR